MSTLKAFFDATKAIVLLGAKTNAACRQEMRDVIGRLADELDRALMLADSYLVGTRFSKDDKELIQYLEGANRKLTGTFLEHHICAGLYHLADKFKQVFDPTRFSVSISSYREVPELIAHLRNGERAVLDDLDEIAQELADYSYKLAAAGPQGAEPIKTALFDAVEYHRLELAKRRKKIKSLRRRVIDAL